MILLLTLLLAVQAKPLELANALKERMWPTAQLTVEKMGREVSLWRPYGIQMELLREDLVWLNQGYTPRQLLIVQAVVLGEALTRAAEAAKTPTDEQLKHLSEILLYQKSGTALLEHYLKELGEVKDSEMRFRL